MNHRWLGDAATAKIRAAIAANLANALEKPLDRMHGYIGEQGPPRSEPGSAPHMDSGQLYDSLYIEVDEAGLAARLGSTVEWAVYTEQGTDRMDPRPWFLPSILQTSDDVARELAK